MEEDKRIYTLRSEKPIKAVFKMGVPLIAGMLVMSLYNLVDTFFIGLLRDDYQLAAVNLAYPVMMVSVALANMVGTGAASLIARSLGSKENDKAEETLTAGIELAVLISLIFGVVGLIFLPQIVQLLGAKENTFSFTKQYVGVILAGSLFTVGSYALGQLLRSEGSAGQAMAGMIAGTITNIILDPVFIFLFKMGVQGTAVATVLGNFVGTVLPLVFYLRKKTLLSPRKKYLLPNGKIFAEIFTVGVPATLETLLTSAAFVINNNLAVAYGELTVTAMGISQKVISIGSNVYQGFAAGNQPLMGYNFGAKNYTRMKQVLKAGIIAVSLVELCVLTAFGLFAPQLIGIFSETEQVIAVGSRVLRANMFSLLFVGSVSMTRSTFQAMGKPLYAFAITVIRQFVLYVPLLLLLNRFLYFNGMIWAQPITECVMMTACICLLSFVLKRYEKTEMSHTDQKNEE